MQHGWKHVERPGGSHTALDGKKAPDTWNCKRAQVSLKATIDVPMFSTIIEQNGDGLLEDSHMPVFFRPTSYGFRQVVQHVSKHVAQEIN